jgi:hypothetical protein
MQANDTAFVIGVFRSGTSLLSLILNQNPKLALMYECDIWNFPRLLMKLRFQRDWTERIEFYNQALSRHRLVTDGNLSALHNLHAPQDLYRAYGALKGATVTGEKSPFFCNRLEQLHREYPGAAFIFVWRNPTEVYRSVLMAGQTSRFFSRPGMLSRMIYLQEQAIRQVLQIEKAGARIFHVDYANLVDDTERVCRDICAFLGVPYDPRMLQLEKADRSAIFNSPHHHFLHRGIIERQKYDRELVAPKFQKKLGRFRRRWEGLQSKWITPSDSQDQSRPGKWEMAYHNLVGAWLVSYDSIVRAGFEFMPLPWLRVYRLLKNWLVNPPSGAADEKTSMVKDFKQNWLTILTATVLLAVVVFAHMHANPHLMFILFYGSPAALVALVVNARWATVFVVLATVITPIVQYDGDPDFRSTFVIVWNFFNRLFLLEIIVLVLSRIRLELVRVSHHAK